MSLSDPSQDSRCTCVTLLSLDFCEIFCFLFFVPGRRSQRIRKLYRTVFRLILGTVDLAHLDLAANTPGNWFLMCAVTAPFYEGKHFFWRAPPAIPSSGFGVLFCLVSCLKRWTCPGSITATIWLQYWSATTQYFVFSLFACLYISRQLSLYITLTVLVSDKVRVYVWNNW